MANWTICPATRREVVDGLESAYGELRGMILPHMLDTGNFRTPGFIGLGVGLVVFLLCAWGISRVMARSSDPSRHPIIRKLARYGDAHTIATQIDYEVNHEKSQTVDGLRFTRSWFVRASSSSLDVMRLDDIVWVYKKVIQHRTNFIPTGKTYAALIWDRHGKHMEISGKQKKVDAILQGTLHLRPGCGRYDQQLQNIWSRPPAVHRRRRKRKGSGKPHNPSVCCPLNVPLRRAVFPLRFRV
jgi:hypothetical protein